MPPGDYKLVLTLTDSIGFPRSFSITVNVPKILPPPPPPPIVGDWKLPPPIPRIIWVNMAGLARVTFSRPITLPTFAQYPEFNDAKFLKQGCTNGTPDACAAKLKQATLEVPCTSPDCNKKPSTDATKSSQSSPTASPVASSAAPEKPTSIEAPQTSSPNTESGGLIGSGSDVSQSHDQSSENETTSNGLP